MEALEGVPRRVVLTGSECTGKTSLAADLARHFGALWLPEFVRGYARWKRAPLDSSDVEPFARVQVAEQDLALARGERLLILDTDLLSTVVYAGHYYGACPEWIRQAARARCADLYLLCDIEVPWQEDPQRDRPHTREEMQALFRAALLQEQFPFVEIRGDWRLRFDQARMAIDSLLTDSPSLLPKRDPAHIAP
jgi:nicotinamide riboside kinase